MISNNTDPYGHIVDLALKALLAVRKGEPVSFTLIIGSKNYSSWSMRAWLLMKLANVKFNENLVPMYTENSRMNVRQLGGQTGLVPVLVDDGHAIWDTMAIAEHLYEYSPNIWPVDKFDRARARSLCGEVHSGINALRNAMPVNTRARRRKAERTQEVENDIERVKQIWEDQLAKSDGPWLFDEFCAADIFFAPVATRFQTYGVSLSGKPAEYYKSILTHPDMLKWLKAGEEETEIIRGSEMPLMD